MLRLPTENTSDREEKIMAKLSDICELVNQKIKINVAINNNLCNKYISTENMLPNKQGISVASNIPSSVVSVEIAALTRFSSPSDI